MCTNYLLDTIYGRRISEALGRKLSSHPAVGPHLAPHTSGHPLAFHLSRLVRAGNEQDFGRHFYRFFSIGPRWGGGGWQALTAPKPAKPRTRAFSAEGGHVRCGLLKQAASPRLA